MAKPNPQVRVVSDGTPGGTMVYLDGKTLRVRGLTWDVDRHGSRLVLEFDGEPNIELEGPMRWVGGDAGRGQELQEDPPQAEYWSSTENRTSNWK